MRDGRPARYELGAGYGFCRVINGGWQLSPGHSNRSTDDTEILDGWTRLVEAGFTTFDVADIYTGVERLAGRVAARFEPGRVQIHTKCVPDRSRLAHLSATALEAMVDGSLKRLAVERIDLLQFHWWDFDIDGWDDALHALDRLREQGKIRHLGVTNFDTTRLETLLDTGLPIRTNQVQYSLLDRRPGGKLATVCRRRGVSLLAYGSLAGGLLTGHWTGKLRPQSASVNRSLIKYLLISDECGGWDALQLRFNAIQNVAAKHGVEPAAVAIRWVLEAAGVAAAVVGARDAVHAEHNLRVFDFQLDSDDHNTLERDAPDGLQGEVYRLERESERHASIMRYELQQPSSEN